MNAREEITKLLEQWFQLTQAEGRAIQLAEWAEVKKIQANKAALQTLLAEARQRFDRENPGRHPRPAAENLFQTIVARLLSLETRNSELMAGQMERANEEKETLRQAEINLRRLQKSYAFKANPVAWNSYS